MVPAMTPAAAACSRLRNRSAPGGWQGVFACGCAWQVSLRLPARRGAQQRWRSAKLLRSGTTGLSALQPGARAEGTLL